MVVAGKGLFYSAVLLDVLSSLGLIHPSQIHELVHNAVARVGWQGAPRAVGRHRLWRVAGLRVSSPRVLAALPVRVQNRVEGDVPVCQRRADCDRGVCGRLRRLRLSNARVGLGRSRVCYLAIGQVHHHRVVAALPLVFLEVVV